MWPSLNPRFLPGGSATLTFNVFQHFNVVLCPSWLCYLHGSCDSLHVHICCSLHVHICYICTAKQLEATASFTLQPLLSQTRYFASLQSSARMQWNNITGTVANHNGEALPRLAPDGRGISASIVYAITGGEVPVHPTRLPMSWSALQVLSSTIYRNH